MSRMMLSVSHGLISMAVQSKWPSESSFLFGTKIGIRLTRRRAWCSDRNQMEKFNALTD